MEISIYPKNIDGQVATEIVLKIRSSGDDSHDSSSVTWEIRSIDGKTIGKGISFPPRQNFLSQRNDLDVYDHVISELNLRRLSPENTKKMKAKIQPHQIEESCATQFMINYVQIREFNEEGSAIVVWSFLNEEGSESIYSGSSIIEGEEYSNWGSDDSYITDLMLQKLGLTRVIEASLVEPETVTENTTYQEILDQLDN